MNVSSRDRAPSPAEVLLLCSYGMSLPSTYIPRPLSIALLLWYLYSVLLARHCCTSCLYIYSMSLYPVWYFTERRAIERFNWTSCFANGEMHLGSLCQDILHVNIRFAFCFLKPQGIWTHFPVKVISDWWKIFFHVKCIFVILVLNTRSSRQSFTGFNYHTCVLTRYRSTSLSLTFAGYYCSLYNFMQPPPWGSLPQQCHFFRFPTWGWPQSLTLTNSHHGHRSSLLATALSHHQHYPRHDVSKPHARAAYRAWWSKCDDHLRGIPVDKLHGKIPGS